MELQIDSLTVLATVKIMIRLKDILQEGSTIPSTLYHAVTSETIRDFVLKNGIKANEQNFVFLSQKPITRAPFKYTFKVKVPHMDRLHDWRDMYDEGPEHQYDESNPYYIYEGDIPKQYIKLT